MTTYQTRQALIAARARLPKTIVGWMGLEFARSECVIRRDRRHIKIVVRRYHRRPATR